MQKQKKIWSQYEDNALKTLRQTRKIQKWSQIAKKLEQQFGIKGKNGKRCRERYYNNLNPQLKKDIWTEHQQKELMKLHNQKGNKWAQIAKILGRSDNSVKNHYHSKLRKGIRRINNRISIYFKNQHRPLKYNIISKIVQSAENVFITKSQNEKLIAQSCYDMKNQILEQSEDKDYFTTVQLQNLKKLVVQINLFNRTHKGKAKSNSKNANSRSLNEENSQSDQNNLSSAFEAKQISQILEKNYDQKVFYEPKKPGSKRTISFNESVEEQLQQTQKNFDQQKIKKYSLRNRNKNNIAKNKEIETGNKISVFEGSNSLNNLKESCKTPSDIDNFCVIENGMKNEKNHYQQFPSIFWGSQLMNNMIFQNLRDSYELHGKNETQELDRKLEINPYNFIMLGVNNFDWNVLKKQESQKMNYENSKHEMVDSKNVFSLQGRYFSQGFVPYKKQE